MATCIYMKGGCIVTWGGGRRRTDFLVGGNVDRTRGI